jgi:uncharacterized protein YegJ (DUF2314 family)
MRSADVHHLIGVAELGVRLTIMKIVIYVFLFIFCAEFSRAADDQVISVSTEDSEMNAAIKTARDTLPSFWKTFAGPKHDETDFFLKVALTDGKETEHFWIGDLKIANGGITGVIWNYPELISNVKYGQSIAIDEKRISDWKFQRGGKIIGGYTIAVLLKHLPKDEAAEFRKQLGWQTEAEQGAAANP